MQPVAIFIIVAFACQTLFAQPTKPLARGGPGRDAHWPSAAKDGFGTSNSLRSKVWFTLTNGVMSEVYYPTLDTPNTQSLQLIFCAAGKCYDEARDMEHTLRLPDDRSLTFQQINTARSFSITKTYTTDTERATVLIDVQIQSSVPGDSTVYLYFDPSLKNSGMHDTAWSTKGALLAADDNISSALVASSGFAQVSNTFLGRDDQLEQLNGLQTWQSYERAENGNVVQLAKLKNTNRFTIALGFGRSPAAALATARRSLAKGFAACRRQYESGWHTYLSSLDQINSRHLAQVNMSAMVLKAMEDKTYRGAFIASPSIPWGGGPNANEATVSGYHAVWSRDLYQVATALLAIGDRAAAHRALDYLFKVQQRRDGSFPQNSWVDGRPIGGGLQMDEIALPIVLAFQLKRTDRVTWLRHLKPAAEFIVSRGPATGQDRWEEKSGYSPATLAAEVAGLICASEIASRNRDSEAAHRYLRTAQEWSNKIETWTATQNGPLGGGNYYLRLTENGNPSDKVEMEINSGGGSYDQRAIVDGGFLELVRLGLRSADDALVRKSINVVDANLKVTTPFGPGWYRYNHDAYGERSDGGPYDGRSGIGRLWTFLSGERGEYELAAGQVAKANEMLDVMAGFANSGRMIPEQVWDRNIVAERIGAGTGSATPLAWSMAQFIRLAVNIERGHNIETLDIVAARNAKTNDRKNHRGQQ